MWDMKRGNLCAIILPKRLWKWNGLKTFIIYYFFSNGKHSSGIAKTIKRKILYIIIILPRDRLILNTCQVRYYPIYLKKDEWISFVFEGVAALIKLSAVQVMQTRVCYIDISHTKRSWFCINQITSSFT